MRCKNNHEYEGLACSACASAASQSEQLRIAESQIRSGVKPMSNGEHFSLLLEDWKHIFREYGWTQAGANVPALCGATIKLSDTDIKKEAEGGRCACEQCKARVRVLTDAARSPQ